MLQGQTPGPRVSYSVSLVSSDSELFISVNIKLMTAPLDSDSHEHHQEFDRSQETVSDERSAYLVERVYLLDDDPDVLKVVESMLQISGYVVQTYRYPTEFLAATEHLAAGVVITDQVMHGMLGIEVQRQLSARPNHFKVILVTAFSTTSLAVEAMKNGAVTVLDKPFNHQELLAAVTEAFRQLRHAGAFDEAFASRIALGAAVSGSTVRSRERCDSANLQGRNE